MELAGDAIAIQDAEYPAISNQIYAKLVPLLDGEAHHIAFNVDDDNGLLVWRKLTRRFAPNTAVSRRVLLGKVLNPGSASLQALNGHIEKWLELKR